MRGFCLFIYIVANVFEVPFYVRWLNGDVAIFATIVLTKVLSEIVVFSTNIAHE